MQSRLTIRRSCAIAGVSFLLTACSDTPMVSAPRETPQPRVFQQMLQQRPDTIVNRYTVVLRRTVPRAFDVAENIVTREGGHPIHVFETALKGFSVANLPPGALERIRAHPAVEYVEESNRAVPAGMPERTQTALGGQWGLDWIDGQATGVYRYFYDGAGVHVYIVDSGIRGGHNEFVGRTSNGAAFINFSSGANPYIDNHGHGTEVAGVAVGATYGVAKNATIHSVRVQDGSNPWDDDVVAGLDWVAANAVLPAVVNLSIMTDHAATSGAIDGVTAHGVLVVLAAGNDGANACTSQKETKNTKALVVGAVLQDFTRLPQSNYGSCVDIWAPGGGVTTANHDNNSAISTGIAGTSIAAPFVTGVAALALQQNPTLTPAELWRLLTTSATPIDSSQLFGAPGRFVNSLFRQMWIDGAPPLVTLYWSPVTYTWSLETFGGNGDWTTQFEVSENGAAYVSLGTARTYTRTLNPGDNFTLDFRATGTSLGSSFSAVYSTQVHSEPPCDPGDPTCCPGQDQCGARLSSSRLPVAIEDGARASHRIVPGRGFATQRRY